MSDNNNLFPLLLSCLSGSLLFSLSAQAQNYSSFEQQNTSLFSTVSKTFSSQNFLLVQEFDNRQRVALVIGNAKYQHGISLNNPVNDANDMAQKLKELGFQVILITDGDLKKMDQAVEQFYNQLNKDSVALFYYAGHAVQVEGENFLLPIDANLDSASDTKYETLATSKVLDKMYEADSEVRIAILDACRDNPFARNWKTRSVSKTRGLAQIQNRGVGDFIAYATQPGNVSEDGQGRNGIFTSYILKHLNNSNQTIEEIFKLVRRDVARHTNNKQVPFTNSGLVGDFYFAKVQTSNSAINNINNNPPEIKENNNQNADFYLTRGNTAYDKKQYDQAITDYNQAIKLNPQFSLAYYNRGLAYYYKGELDKAIADYNQAIQINKNWGTISLAIAYYNRGLAYGQKGELEQAIADYNQAIKLNPQSSLAYNNRGLAHYGKGELEQAIADFNQAIKLNPQSSLAYNNRGLAYYYKGELDKAIADYNQAIQINKNWGTISLAIAYNNRGLVYGQKGELEQAIADFNQAIKLNPQSSLAYRGRGFAYYHKGELDKAITDYNQALNLNPQDSITYNNRGLAHYGKGELEQAIADYNQAIKLNPQSSLAYVDRGLAYYHKGELDKAIADYNQAIKLNPQFSLAYNNRGLAHYGKGELEQAIADYNQAIKLNPQFSLAYYNRGLAYGQKGELDKAIADYNQAIKLNPQYSNAYVGRGLAYEQKRQYDQAMKDYDQAIQLDPNNQYAINNKKRLQERLRNR